MATPTQTSAEMFMQSLACNLRSGYTLKKMLDHAGDDEDDEVCLTQLTRPQVQANLVQHEKLFDSGKGPRCHCHMASMALLVISESALKNVSFGVTWSVLVAR